jgi:hypothetical protein
VDNVTIYLFLYPILSPDSAEKSRNIWCAKDKVTAWHDMMLRDKAPAAASCDVTALQRNLALGKHKITGTPTLIFEDNSRVPGAIRLPRWKNTSPPPNAKPPGPAAVQALFFAAWPPGTPPSLADAAMSTSSPKHRPIGPQAVGSSARLSTDALEPPHAPLQYRVEALDLHAHLFAVRLRIAAPPAGQQLSLPVWIPGSYLVREFAKNLQG